MFQKEKEKKSNNQGLIPVDEEKATLNKMQQKSRSSHSSISRGKNFLIAKPQEEWKDNYGKNPIFIIWVHQKNLVFVIKMWQKFDFLSC